MTDQTIRVLEQAVGIAKQRIEMLEKDNSSLQSDLEFWRYMYAEIKKSEEFWRLECASEERKTSVAITSMFVALGMSAAWITIAILVCQ
jgi:hypothetical protein